MIHKGKSVVRIILLTIFSLLIGINIYSWNSRRLLGDAMPMTFGYGWGVILSGSMEPTLSVDDLIIVRKQDNYKVNDIIVYQVGYELITHRIIYINEDEVITKGDANNIEDNKISTNNIKGKVICSIPFIGIITDFFKKPIVFLITLIISMILLELSYRKQKQSNDENLQTLRDEINRLKNQ